MHSQKQIVSMGICEEKRGVLDHGTSKNSRGKKRRIGADVGSICWPANISPGLRLGDGASEDFRERPGDDPQDIRHTNRSPQLLGNGRNRHILDTTWNDGLEKG